MLWWAPDPAGRGPTSDIGSAQLGRDSAELSGDGECEGSERHDHAERDHGQHNAVLGHRLALLAHSVSAQNGIPVANSHGVTPPFASGGDEKVEHSKRLGARSIILCSEGWRAAAVSNCKG